MLCSSGLARFFFSLSLNFYFALAFDFPPAGGEIFCNSFWTSSGDILPWASAEAPPDDSVFEPQPLDNVITNIIDNNRKQRPFSNPNDCMALSHLNRLDKHVA